MSHVPKRNKFNAVKVKIDGMTFDSKAEYARYCELVLLEKAGQIKDLVIHPRYTLRAFDEVICSIVPDFTYHENGKWVVEDVKGGRATMTPSFRIKLKLFHANYPDAIFRIHGLKQKWPSLKRKGSPIQVKLIGTR